MYGGGDAVDVRKEVQEVRYVYGRVVVSDSSSVRMTMLVLMQQKQHTSEWKTRSGRACSWELTRGLRA